LTVPPAGFLDELKQLVPLAYDASYAKEVYSAHPDRFGLLKRQSDRLRGRR
jgi:hypothetical protein